MAVMKTYLSQKLGLAEFDALKVVVERLHTELAAKSATRELDSLHDYVKN